MSFCLETSETFANFESEISSQDMDKTDREQERRLKTPDNLFEEDLRNAIGVLRRGGIILYPTDTVWGIGCDATNPEAIERIYRLKRRSDSKSMLSLVDSVAMLERYVDDIPDAAYQLLEAAVEPLTIIFDHPSGLAETLLAPDGSAGMRITSERFSRELCRRLRRPLVSTSANISGMPPARDYRTVADEIRSGVDYAVAYGRSLGADARPSAVIKVSDGGLIKIIR